MKALELINSIPVIWRTIFLLVCSNCFMTFAWYAHLKNMLLSPLPGGGSSYAVTRLSDGYIDQYRVMQFLKKHLKGDMIAIEYPCPGDGVIAALKDMEYIRFLKNELNIQ